MGQVLKLQTIEKPKSKRSLSAKTENVRELKAECFHLAVLAGTPNPLTLAKELYTWVITYDDLGEE